jgi:preprotein translocase subunit Sss1
MKTNLSYEELNEKLRSYERVLKEAKDKELIKNYKEYI